MRTRTLHVVLCFHDNDLDALRTLEAHLTSLKRDGTATIWHKGKILPGDRQEDAILENLRVADVIVLLVSADFNADWDARITESIKATPSLIPRVIPIIVRPCSWVGLPFFGLQPAPEDGEPITKNGIPVEERVYLAAQSIRKVALDLRNHELLDSSTPTAAPHTLVATLAQLEHERHALQQQLHLATRGADRTDLPKPSPADLSARSTRRNRAIYGRQIDDHDIPRDIFSALNPASSSISTHTNVVIHPATPTTSHAWTPQLSNEHSDGRSPANSTEPLKPTLASPTADNYELPPEVRLGAVERLMSVLVRIIGPEAQSYTEVEMILTAATLLDLGYLDVASSNPQENLDGTAEPEIAADGATRRG